MRLPSWFKSVAFSSVVVACSSETKSVSLGTSATAHDTFDRTVVLLTDTTPQCANCVVEVSRALTIADAPGMLSLTDLPLLRRDSKGNYYALLTGKPFEGMPYYDSTGKFIGTIGRKGRGPGELTNPSQFLVGLGDSLYLLDYGRRFSVFGPDGKFARERRLQLSPNTGFGLTRTLMPLADGRIIVNSSIPSKDYAGIPLFQVNQSGSIDKGFGTMNLASIGSLSMRVVTAGRDNKTAWVAEPGNYRLEEIDLVTQETKRVIGVNAPWFDHAPIMTVEESRDHFAKTTMVRKNVDVNKRPERMEHAPMTFLRDMQLDERGRMWLVWQVPAAGWDTVTLKYPHLEEMAISNELNDRLWSSVVDVLDVERGALVARRRFPFHAHLAAPEFIAHSYFDESGIPKVEVWQMRVTPP